jgi:non-canonical purine NTP pyrophosphatase (RdgB/HAM1 family)
MLWTVDQVCTPSGLRAIAAMTGPISSCCFGPEGVLASATGRLFGRIGNECRGENGFGYDPIFYIEDGRTIAELGPAEKNAISHRGRALREILPALLIAIGAYRFSSHGAGQ